jgi:phosphotransferase system HPr (HPr) family protein
MVTYPSVDYSFAHPHKMSMSVVTRVIVIQNAQGLHARPAEMFARLAQKFRSRIELVRETHRVEAKNIMELLTLGAAQGTELTLEADGDDAQEAVDALARLVESGFSDQRCDNEQQADGRS